MSNIISYDARPDLPYIMLSNGATAVFISVLSLATSILATTDRHRLFAVWLSSRDQGVYGTGCVGFDIDRLPWSPETFNDDKEFLLSSIDAASAKLGWDRLSYPPNMNIMGESLVQFRTLIESFYLADIAQVSAQPGILETGSPSTLQFTKCQKHGIYKHEDGCIICNDS